jgi:catechol 2,3-dioxygenase-like lactoylglutathione lyase family enzyme
VRIPSTAIFRFISCGRTILWTVTVLFMFAASAFAEPRLLGVGAIGMTVSDVDRSVGFFSRVLDFRKISDTEFHNERFDRLTGIFGARVRIVKMKLGDEMIELTEYLTPQGQPIPLDSQSNDLWFQHIAIVVRDMDAAYARLSRNRVKPISVEPQRIPDWNKAAAGVRAFYFRDPDNHALELIWFPPGKGDPRWQKKGNDLFLGIDHTAIAVSDTDASLAFYRDLLGFRVAGESLNYGREQEYLNHVFGSRVRITGLRAPQGPGIEFLEYITPGDGRPYPDDSEPNDILYWQVTVQVEDASGLYRRLPAGRARPVSPEVIDIEPLQMGGKRATLVRDPDLHALQFVEK